MASRIKGITIEIGGDTTGLQTALKGVNSQIRTTQSALKDVERLLKLDPSNTELLSQKQKLLAQAIGETKEKLTTLRTAAEQANEQLQIKTHGSSEWCLTCFLKRKPIRKLQSLSKKPEQRASGNVDTSPARLSPTFYGMRPMWATNGFTRIHRGTSSQRKH